MEHVLFCLLFTQILVATEETPDCSVPHSTFHLRPPTPEIRQQCCLPPPGVGNCFITEFLESEAMIIIITIIKTVLQPDVTDVDVWGSGIEKLAWS